MRVPVTHFKKELFRILKTILPENFSYRDSEDSVDAGKTPGVCISTDAGTEFSKTEYGLNQGKTSVKLDVFVSVGKTFRNNAETDQLQHKIRQAVLSDPLIRQNYPDTEFTKIAALSIPGESRLRVLTHDIEFLWTEVSESE